MGKHKNTTKTGREEQGYTFPTPSFWGGKPEHTAPNLIEEVSMQIGTCPKVPFRLTQLSRSPSVCSVSPMGGHTFWGTPDDWMHCCIHVTMTLGEGGDQPTLSHVWSKSLIAHKFQDDLKELITKAVILAPGEAILFFGRQLHKEGLPFGSARDVRFRLKGSVNWAERLPQVEATVNTVQEGHQAIADTVMEMKKKAREWGKPSYLQLVPAR